MCSLSCADLPRRPFHAAAAALVSLRDPDIQSSVKRALAAIHPDRVAQHPRARRANSLAFQTLREYLAELKGDGASGAAQLHHLDFFVWLHDVAPDGSATPMWQDVSTDQTRPVGITALDPRVWTPGQEAAEQRARDGGPPEGAARGADAGGADAQAERGGEETRQLRRVTMRLPPPPPHCAERLPRAVRQALARLFKSLHLPSSLAVEDDGPQHTSVRPEHSGCASTS